MPPDAAANHDDLLRRAQEHQHRHVSRAEIRTRVHGAGLAGRFNKRLALFVTIAVGSMWCAYAFVGLAFISLPAAVRSGDPVILVSWISQTFLQLVLLSVIMVGQNVVATAADQRAEADHETLQLLHEISTRQLEILQEQRLSQQVQDRVLAAIVAKLGVAGVE
jgi:hypothetical protein